MTTFTARHTNGQRCDRATRTHDCPHQHDYTDESATRINALIHDVANLLPFPVTIDEEMGGTGALQINLGGTQPDDPTNRVGIDPDSDTTPTWWIDLATKRQIISQLTLVDSPTNIAAWIRAETE